MKRIIFSSIWVLIKFVLAFIATTIGCVFVWETFVDGSLYHCTDPTFGYLTPDGWIGGNGWPVVAVQHVLRDRPPNGADTIKQGWTILDLWCIWWSLFLSSLALSVFLAWMSWASVRRFQALLKDINFWHLPVDPPSDGPGVLGGDMFLYESAWHGKYRVVQAPDPENHKLIGPGLYLLNLAGEREPD